MKKTSKPHRKTVQETRASYQVTPRAGRTVKSEVAVSASVREAAQQLAQQLGLMSIPSPGCGRNPGGFVTIPKSWYNLAAV